MLNKQNKLAEDLSRCRGKYVATHEERVVACGGSIKEVKDKVAAKNIKGAAIFPWPDFTKGRHYF